MIWTWNSGNECVGRYIFKRISYHVETAVDFAHLPHVEQRNPICLIERICNSLCLLLYSLLSIRIYNCDRQAIVILPIRAGDVRIG